MQVIQERIELLNTLFIVCLVLCIIFLLLSIIFFFKFDIINIFNVKTGRSVKKSVKEINEVNARTGQLRQPSVRLTNKKSEKLKKSRIQSPLEARQAGMTVTDPLENNDSQPENAMDAAATTVLDEGASSTTVLDGAAGGTTVLSQGQRRQAYTPQAGQPAETGTEYNIEIAQNETDEQYGKFKVLTSVLLIHTKEAV